MGSLQQVAYIVVVVGWFSCCRACGYLVNINIEYFGRYGNNALYAAFFLCFTQRGSQRITVAICMTAGLQPPPQLAMQRKQRFVSRWADQPGRACYVSLCVAAFEAIRCVAYELFHIVGYTALLRVLFGKKIQLLAQSCSRIGWILFHLLPILPSLAQ